MNMEILRKALFDIGRFLSKRSLSTKITGVEINDALVTINTKYHIFYVDPASAVFAYQEKSSKLLAIEERGIEERGIENRVEKPKPKGVRYAK